MSFSSVCSSLETAGAEAVEAEGRQARWPYPAVAAGAVIFFYLQLFRFPLIPIWHDGDESSYLEHAEHMLHCQVLYRDLFQFNMPGTEYLYYFFFRVFGLHLWVGHLAFLIALTSVTVLVFALSRVVLRGWAALLPPLAFLAICQRSSIDGTHHWYSTPLVLLAIYLIARVRTPLRVALAGGILGTATLFTSTRGIFVAGAVALFLVWELRNRHEALKAMGALFAPFAAVVGVTLTYLALRVTPKVLFDSLVVFPLRYYPSGSANSFGIYYEEIKNAWPLGARSLMDIAHWLLSSAAMPLLLVAIGVWLYRSGGLFQPGSRSNRTLVLYAFVSLFALLPVIGAPSAPRLNCALSFAYIVGAVMLFRADRRKLLSATLGVLLLATFAEMSAAILRPYYALQSPRGPVDFMVQDRRDYLAWFLHNAHPGDRAFGDIDISFILGLENPARVQWLEKDAYTRPEQVRNLVETFSKQTTRFVLYYELPGKGSEDNLQPLRDYLKQNYHVVHGPSDDPNVVGQVPDCSTCAPVLVRNGW